MNKSTEMQNPNKSKYTHADLAEIYEKAVTCPRSYVANKDVYARVPLSGMPCPTGRVYRG